MIKLRGTGRGTGYGLKKSIVEAAKQLIFAGGWHTTLWGALPGTTRVRLLERTLPILPPRPDPRVGRPRRLVLGLVTDLHVGSCTHPKALDSAFAQLAAKKPDLLLLGGDYVYHEATPNSASRLEELVASVPSSQKFAVWGNHDLWARHERLERALDAAGARLLVNQATALESPFDDVVLLGLDDAHSGVPDPRGALKQARGALPRGGLLLALSHSTDYARSLAEGGVALLMAGHTHGGQIALPGGRPVIVYGPYGHLYPHGWHQLGLAGRGAMEIFVSRGVGAVGLPLRILAPADIAVITLVERPAGGYKGGP